MSGITTTGATIIADLDESPKSILLWRAIMQWLGRNRYSCNGNYNFTSTKSRRHAIIQDGRVRLPKKFYRTFEVATIIISTYLVLTFLCGLFYWLFGMSIFDSISHAMTTIATGGFSTHNDSIGFFKNSNIEIIASVFIVLGSIPFISYLKFVQGNKNFFRMYKLKGFIQLIVISVLIMFLYLLFIRI